MNHILAALLLLSASPAMAAECFRHEFEPGWTITVNDPGVEPEMVWKQAGKTVDLGTSGAGTGVPVRVAWNEEGEGYRFFIHKGDLIFDMDVYVPGCD